MYGNWTAHWDENSLDMVSKWASVVQVKTAFQLTNYVSFFCPCLLQNVRNIWKFGVDSPFTTTCI